MLHAKIDLYIGCSQEQEEQLPKPQGSEQVSSKGNTWTELWRMTKSSKKVKRKEKQKDEEEKEENHSR